MRWYSTCKLFVIILCCSLMISACANGQGAGDNDRDNDGDNTADNTAQVRQNADADGNLIRGLSAVPNQQPYYARWGKMAMEKVKRRYPNANIVDYQHVDRRATETFRYELNQNGRDFAVLSTITFDPETNRVISVDIRNETRTKRSR